MHTNSAAFQYSFLQQPVVDEWINALRHILEKKFQLLLPQQSFEFQPTYDIDIAWAYLNKPRKQNIAGALRDLLKLRIGWFFDRILVASSGRQDPYDAFKWMEDLQKYYELQPVYFFLVGANGTYDRNISPSHPEMQVLIRHTSTHAQVGLHPSYGSFLQQSVMEKELHVLETILDKPVWKSRQHYIKMSLPDTYRQLEHMGIQNDYSMGYPTINGFRAGTSRSFMWYDLSNETKSELRVHPFCFMETTAINQYNGSKTEAYAELERIVFTLRQSRGKMISIFHNNNLGSGREHKGWYKFYQKMIELIHSEQNL